MSETTPTPADYSPSVHRPSRRNALIIGALGVALLVALLFATTRNDQHSPATGASVDVGHIHGIGVDPADGVLYIGAHLGTFSVDADGTVVPVGSERNDTMAFTVTGPGRFLASGHPGPGSEQPVHLGLIQSRDAADSWDPVSLSGVADFHAIDVGPTGRTWAADSVRGLLLTSTNTVDWQKVGSGQFIDVAADPAGADTALITTGAGELRSVDAAGESASVPDSPALTFLDWMRDGSIVGLDPEGQVMVSTADLSTWEAVGQVPGQPTALDLAAEAWYAASTSGLYASTDSGTSWEPLFTYGSAQ